MKVYYETSDSLMHYGVPGMKWGVKRAKAPISRPSSAYGSAKAKYKAAKKAYSKSYNKSYNLSANGFANLLSKKHRAARDASWEDTYKKVEQLDTAKKNYKKAKQDRKAKIKAAKQQYKDSKRAYNKAYNRAEGYSSRHLVSQFIGKSQKAESNKRWNEAYAKGREMDAAKKKYKAAKKKR